MPTITDNTPIKLKPFLFIITSIVLLLVNTVVILSASSLDGFVSFYEVTHLNSPVLDEDGTYQPLSRFRRETLQPYRRHSLSFFNRSLTLLLESDRSAFSPDHVVDDGSFAGSDDNGDLGYLVNGVVFGFEDRSHVHGVVINGRFQGEISLANDETYFVEDAEKFTKNNEGMNKGGSSMSSMSVVYRFSDIRQSNRTKLCGWPVSGGSLPADSFGTRIRRQTRSPIAAAIKMADNTTSKVCGLYIQVDHLLYEEYLKDADFHHDTAVKQIMGLVNFAVNSVNEVFSTTEFISKDGSIGPFGKIRFSIIRTKIYKSSDEFSSRFGVAAAEVNRSLDAVTFLNMISGANYDHFCASYVFTYRYFDGILGLAWLFSATDHSIYAGVCARYGRVSAPKMTSRSQNTGMLTFVNYGQRVSMAVAAITFAHELGHNFGAEHDNADGADANCAPGGRDGNFIMFSSATSGDKPNNQKYSQCSRHLMALAINELIQHPVAGSCLKDVVQLCGNAVVDPDEECDCGFTEDCGSDANCCGPADDPDPKARCRLRTTSAGGQNKVECSLSNGICCNVTSCSFIQQSANFHCRSADECKQAAFCNGTSAICPEGVAVSDGKICGGLTKICRAGECKASVCEIIAGVNDTFSSCQSERPPGQRRYNRSELCYLACRSPTSGRCFNSVHLDSTDFDDDFRRFLVNTSQGHAIQLRPGSPCDNDRGYCDALQKCRPISAEGPLARLTSLILSVQTAQTVRSWLELNWYLVAFICVASVVMGIAFLKFCSVHTRSDNRALPPARTIGETLRRATLIRQRFLANKRLQQSEPPSSSGHQQASAEMSLLGHDEDQQVPNRQQGEASSSRIDDEQLSPALQLRIKNQKRQPGRGHVRSKRTRIVHSEYHVPPPSLLRQQHHQGATRPETILE